LHTMQLKLFKALCHFKLHGGYVVPVAPPLHSDPV
jgi:hypothetical protein